MEVHHEEEFAKQFINKDEVCCAGIGRFIISKVSFNSGSDKKNPSNCRPNNSQLTRATNKTTANWDINIHYQDQIIGETLSQYLHLEDILGTLLCSIIDSFTHVGNKFKGGELNQKNVSVQISNAYRGILCLSLHKRGGGGVSPDTSSTHLPLPIKCCTQEFLPLRYG